MKSINKGRKKGSKSMPRKRKLEQKEEMVNLFDPIVNAYREFPLTLALKFIESAKEAEKKLSEQKNNERKSNRKR